MGLLSAGAESAGVSVVVGGLGEAVDGGAADMSTHAIIRCDMHAWDAGNMLVLLIKYNTAVICAG